jgi:hypothetical protein
MIGPMIVWTDYDLITGVLARYAQTLVAEALGRFLVLRPPANSQSDNVQQTLSQDGAAPLFFFGHGSFTPPEWYGQDLLPIVSNGTYHLLQDRLVYAICCHSINGIGQFATNFGITIVGYRGELCVFYEQPYEDLMQDCALAGPRALLNGASVQVAQDVSKEKYRKLAAELTATQDMNDQVIALFVEMNANAVELVGAPDRTL